MSVPAQIVIAAVGVVLAPVCLFTSSLGTKLPKMFRRVLVGISCLDIFVILLALETPRLLRESIGRFDDAMLGVIALGQASLMITVVAMTTGYLYLWLRRGKGP